MVAINFIEKDFIDPNKKTKMRGNDRAFALELIDGEAPVSSTGLIDRRLFSGDNKIRATRDESSGNLWYFRYEHGTIPEDLAGRFTTFDKAKDYLEKYFNTRNVKIKEVLD